MKLKKISAMLLAFMMSVGMFSTTAFAYTDETAVNNDTTEVVTEESEKENEESMNSLTPDGNLTLVDDEGVTTNGGKQFVTMVTKNGNYFYLIIDRDDEGAQTVHFLNQVDEVDLLALMEDEEAQKYTSITEKPVTEETESDATEEIVEKEPVAQKSTNMMPIILLVVVLLVGGGMAVYMFMNKKKKADQIQPDPDADYNDDEDYGYEEESEEEESDDDVEILDDTDFEDEDEEEL